MLFCGPTQEPVLATANTEKKIGEVLEKKMQVNGSELAEEKYEPELCRQMSKTLR